MLKSRKKINKRCLNSKKSRRYTAKKGGNYIYNNNHPYLSTRTINKGNYILFCSEGYRTIPDGELPPMKYVWAQLSREEPTPLDSWFCPYFINRDRATYYVYKIIKDLKLLFVEGYTEFGNKLIEHDKSLAKKIRFPLNQHASDYVNIALQYNLFNIDGIFRDDVEVILFSPFNDKLEFVKRYGGENLKTTWDENNMKAKGYFTPSNNLIKEVKNKLVLLPEYNRIKKYIK